MARLTNSQRITALENDMVEIKNNLNEQNDTLNEILNLIKSKSTVVSTGKNQSKGSTKTSSKKSSTKAQTSSKKSEKEPVKVLGVEIEKFSPCKDKDGYYLWQGFRGYKYQRSEFCYAVQGMKRDSHKNCDYDKKWAKAKAEYEKHFGAYVPKDER